MQMINTLLGTKSHMSQVFTEDGKRLAVTVVKTGPNIVSQVKTEDKHGYNSLQLAWDTRNLRTLKKPQAGHLKKVTTDKKVTFKFLREVSRTAEDEYSVGDSITPSQVLEAGDLVAVTGKSKGKGFQGGVKRWGFAGGPRTHGQSDRLRAPGSIGQGTTPGRVWKGKKMAGRMGNDQQTVKNLTVLKIDEATGELFLSGPVPGTNGSLLIITKIGKNPKEFTLAGAKKEDIVDENVRTSDENLAADAVEVEVLADQTAQVADESENVEAAVEPEAEESEAQAEDVVEEKKEEDGSQA